MGFITFGSPGWTDVAQVETSSAGSLPGTPKHSTAVSPALRYSVSRCALSNSLWLLTQPGNTKVSTARQHCKIGLFPRTLSKESGPFLGPGLGTGPRNCVVCVGWTDWLPLECQIAEVLLRTATTDRDKRNRVSLAASIGNAGRPPCSLETWDDCPITKGVPQSNTQRMNKGNLKWIKICFV